MKKAISIILSLALVLPFLTFVTGCTPKSEFDYLADYTVVYPADYEEWQKKDVTFIADVIEKLTGRRPEVSPDTEPEKEKEIILAGSARELAKTSFDDELSYTVFSEGSKIVLGGNGYYANVRAIYEFINNYIGYDDLTDSVSGLVPKSLDEPLTVSYKAPAGTVMAYARGRYPFGTPADVKDYVEAGFNTVRIDASEIDVDLLREYGKWCARFGVRIMYDALINIEKNDVNTPDFDVTVKNPMVYGHYLVILATDRDPQAIPDFDRYMTIIPALNYEENYGKYGWKLVVEIPDVTNGYLNDELVKQMIKENKTTGFKGTYAVSLNTDIPILSKERQYDRTYLEAYELAVELKNACGAKELWASAYGTNMPLDEEYDACETVFDRNASLAEAFGATGLVYSNYKRGIVVNTDYSHGKHWEEVQRTNTAFAADCEIRKDYEYLGTEMRDSDYYYDLTTLENPYVFEDADLFTMTQRNIDFGFILGYFRNKENGNIAVYGFGYSSVPQKAYDQLPDLSIQLSSSKPYKVYYLGEEATLIDLGVYDQKLVFVKSGQGILMTIGK